MVNGVFNRTTRKRTQERYLSEFAYIEPEKPLPRAQLTKSLSPDPYLQHADLARIEWYIMTINSVSNRTINPP